MVAGSYAVHAPDRFAKRGGVRDVRLALGWTQVQLAAVLRVSLKQVKVAERFGWRHPWKPGADPRHSRYVAWQRLIGRE